MIFNIFLFNLPKYALDHWYNHLLFSLISFISFFSLSNHWFLQPNLRFHSLYFRFWINQRILDHCININSDGYSNMVVKNNNGRLVNACFHIKKDEEMTKMVCQQHKVISNKKMGWRMYVVMSGIEEKIWNSRLYYMQWNKSIV